MKIVGLFKWIWLDYGYEDGWTMHMIMVDFHVRTFFSFFFSLFIKPNLDPSYLFSSLVHYRLEFKAYEDGCAVISYVLSAFRDRWSECCHIEEFYSQFWLGFDSFEIVTGTQTVTLKWSHWSAVDLVKGAEHRYILKKVIQIYELTWSTVHKSLELYSSSYPSSMSHPNPSYITTPIK